MISTSSRQRHLIRLALKLLGAAAAGGGVMVVRTQGWWSLSGLAAGFLAFVIAERLLPAPAEIEPEPGTPPPRSFWLALGIGAVLCFIAGLMVNRGAAPIFTHTLWVLGLSALFAAAYLSWRSAPSRWQRGMRGDSAPTSASEIPPRPPLAKGRERRAIAVTLFFLAAVATVSFGWDLTNIPPEVHGDEGEEGWDAVRLLEEKPFNLFSAGWYDLPRFHVFRLAVAFKLLGVNLFALRCTSVVLGVASVLLLFGLTYQLWGFETAVVAGLLLAVARFFIHLSRTGYSYVDAPFYSVLVAWLFVLAWRRRSAAAAVCCGIALGLGMQTYFAARLVPLLLTVTWLLWLARDPSSWRGQVGFFALIVASALASAAPAIGYFWNHAGELWSRTRDTSVFSEGALHHLAYGYGTSNFHEILLIQLRKAVTAFHLTGDTSLQYGYREPLLDRVSGAALVLGLGELCARPLQRRNQLVLLWTVVPLVAGGALTIDTPFYPRMGGMVPFVMVIVAVAISSVVNEIRAVAPGTAGGVLARLVAAAALAAIITANVQAYFSDYAPNHRHGPAVEIAAWIRAHGGGKTTYMVGGLPGYSINHGTIRLLTYGYSKADIPDLDAFLHGRRLDPAHSAFIIMPSARDRISVLAAALGPLDVSEQHGLHDALLFYSAVPTGAAGAASADQEHHGG